MRSVGSPAPGTGRNPIHVRRISGCRTDGRELCANSSDVCFALACGGCRERSTHCSCVRSWSWASCYCCSARSRDHAIAPGTGINPSQVRRICCTRGLELAANSSDVGFALACGGCRERSTHCSCVPSWSWANCYRCGGSAIAPGTGINPSQVRRISRTRGLELAANSSDVGFALACGGCRERSTHCSCVPNWKWAGYRNEMSLCTDISDGNVGPTPEHKC